MLCILKLGGSVITEKKAGKFKAKAARLKGIAKEIAKARAKGGFDLVIVHGAGPFGHKMVVDYGIANGVKTKRQIEGVAATHDSMETLDKAVVGALLAEKIPAITLQPSAMILQENKKIVEFDLSPVLDFLGIGLVPVLYGDIVPDKALGASVVSGDAIISYLAKELGADKIFLGTDVDGIFDSDPRKNKKARLIGEINDSNFGEALKKASGSSVTDVTQGMKGKLLEIRGKIRGRECIVFNLEKKGNLLKLLSGGKISATKIYFKIR